MKTFRLLLNITNEHLKQLDVIIVLLAICKKNKKLVALNFFGVEKQQFVDLRKNLCALVVWYFSR